MSKEFPDIAFVNVGGQAVPFTKPQHYKKGSTTDTLLTGEDNPLPTKDESVEARLQAIEQTQSQILDKLNDTIDTRLTGSNDEYRMPVEIEGSNISYSIFKDEVVLAGTNLVSDPIKFKGTRVALGIRYDRASDVKINLAPYAADVNLAISGQINVVDIKSGTRGINDVKLLSNNNAIVVRNESEEDIVITRLSVTEFMASGNGGEQSG